MWAKLGQCTAVAVLLGSIGLGAAPAASSIQAAAGADMGIPQLIAEIRALRAEMKEALSTSTRMQLLLGRLQLQEQRAIAIAKQLTDLQQSVNTLQQAKIPLDGELRRLESLSQGGATPEIQRAAASQLAMTKARLEQLQREEGRLRAQEAELSNQLAFEQSRWTAFSSQLEALEQELATRGASQD